MNLISRQRNFMNTTITTNVVRDGTASTVEITDTIENAFGEFDRIVNKFTRFSESSELSNLNRRSGKWTQVSEELFWLVETMLGLSAKSAGAFDPTVIDFLEAYGYDPNYDFSKLDNPDLDHMVNSLTVSRPAWEHIEIDEAHYKIKLVEGQRIDLGGIGKGYAIDCAYSMLDRFSNFSIDAGGDIRAKGVNAEGSPWRLGLSHKVSNSPNGEVLQVGTISSSDIALACSGSWARRVKQFHHIINTRTGKPVDKIRTVFVTAPTATLADGWATALFVGGKDLLTNIPHELAAMLIFEDEKVIKTDNFVLD